MNKLDINEGKRLLVVALNAALPVAKLDDMVIFEEGHFVHVELEEDGIVIAADKEDEFGVWIEPVEIEEEVETLAGTRKESFLRYKIWIPVWDDGDPSVGIQGGFMLGENKEPFAIAKNAGAAAVTAVTWITSYNVTCAVDNALETDYYCQEVKEPW